MENSEFKPVVNLEMNGFPNIKSGYSIIIHTIEIVRKKNELKINNYGK